MRANRAYTLTVGRAGSRLFRAPDEIDSVEIVEIATGEIVFFWDIPATSTRRFTNALKTDLAQLEEDVFLERWSEIDGPFDI